MICPRYRGWQEEEARIDKQPIEELRERCKALVHSNKLLLAERAILPKRKYSKTTQTDDIVPDQPGE